jgi:hypothetical protein
MILTLGPPVAFIASRTLHQVLSVITLPLNIGHGNELLCMSLPQVTLAVGLRYLNIAGEKEVVYEIVPINLESKMGRLMLREVHLSRYLFLRMKMDFLFTV